MSMWMVCCSRHTHRFVPALLGALLLAATPGAAAPAPKPGACALPLSKLYELVSPAVVSITSAAMNPYDSEHPISRRSGSGVIVDPSGLILTNAHVVRRQPVVTVTLDDGTTLPARLVGSDTVFDIAFIQVTPRAPLPFARLGDSDALQVGDEVAAIGNPFGLDQTLTRGIVSAVNRVLPGATWSLKEPLIQTDAAINPGNSGGPLVDLCGSVVGLTTAILPDAQGIGFAIPVSLVKSVTHDLLANGHVVRPWVGIQGALVAQPLRELLRAPMPMGLLVEVVEPGSPAALAGMRGGDLDMVVGGQPFLIGGDVVTAINGVAVTEPVALAATLASLKVGGRVTMSVARGGEVRDLDVGVIERPSQHADDPENPLDLPVSPSALPHTAASAPARQGGRFAPAARPAF
jgi:S1-C subfamily serine protease